MSSSALSERQSRASTRPGRPQLASGVAGSGCRFCGARLRHSVVDLGLSPLCESFVPAERLDAPEAFYPLEVFVCDRCWLVQVPAHVDGREIFGGEYAYFASYSETWVQHAARYAAGMIDRLGLGPASQVVEVASNDGYLLQHFLARDIPVLGIEPAGNVAQAAMAKGVPADVGFFGSTTARRLVARGCRADLLVGNNVLAQVPDLNDFVAALAVVLKPNGLLTLEFPHLVRLIAGNQFDTIYQEHYSYFSLLAAERILSAHGLVVVDVEELPTHGGSLRLFARRADAPAGAAVRPSVAELRERERADGYAGLEPYAAFADRVARTKRELVRLLLGIKAEGKQIVGYGAPGKGNTLLNYCGIGRDVLDYTVDRSPFKQGRYLPGTRIPVRAPDRIGMTRPDYLLILPWNLREEITRQLAYARSWGARFIVPIPTPEVYA